MVFIMTPYTSPYGFFMKKISSMMLMFFIYMLSASTPVYATTDTKVEAEDTAKVEATDEEKKEGAEDEEPECD